MADALFEAIQNRELKLYMEALLANGLLLIIPPARIWHAHPLQPEFREHILDQLLTRRSLTTLSVIQHFRWNYSNIASIMADQNLYATRIHITAQLMINAGALDYHLSCDPFLNWVAERPGATLQDYPSDDSDESTAQNYPSTYPIMKPLNILAWNVRGCGVAQFRRAFMELIGRHKPNIVLLTETRVGGERVESIIGSLGFSASYKVDPMGYARGLWLLWNNEEIIMHIESHTFQEIYAIAEVSPNSRALLTFVYASPIRERRKMLWRNLSSIAPNVDIPWLVCGDFNDVLLPSEKWGNRVVNGARIFDFKNC